MHLHTPSGQAVSAMKDGLLEHTQTGMIARSDIAYHEYEGIATDLDERERLIEDMGDKHVMILRNHGTMALTKSVGEFFLRLFLLERASADQMPLTAAGPGYLHT